jgi:DNA-binding LacI/PurR family transcriptional regulator
MTPRASAPARAAVPGIRDVAAAAGVSVTTVSHALNGRGRLSDATREHVVTVAARLGYTANPSARNMRGATTGIVAVVTQLSEGSTWGASDLEYVMRLNQAVCTAAWAGGLYPTLLPPGVDVTTLARMPLDGAIIVDPVPDDPTLRALHELALPTVSVGRDARAPSDGGWWVDNDIRAITTSALDLLAAGGAQRVAMLTADTGQSYMTDAAEAYEQWCGARDASPRLLLLPAAFRAEECTEVVARACTGGEPVDAVYVVAEAMVRPTLEALHRCALRFPADVQVLLASDTEIARTTRPGLTAVDLHPAGIGRAAVELLTARLQGDAGPRTRLVPASVTVRGSTRPAAGAQRQPVTSATTGGTSS